MPPSFASERRALLDDHRRARGVYRESMSAHARALGTPAEIGVTPESSVYVDSEDHRRALEALRRFGELEDEYFRRLARVVISTCPHCEKPLYRSFDALGIDGLWWRSDATPDEPKACPHFCVLLGAVDLGNHRPAVDFDVHLGPGAPFVVPRLMEHAGMTVVLSAIAMPDGATAYPTAYFAPRRPPVQALAASWARTNFVYTTQLGEHGWRRADEPAAGAETPDAWDFDLGPWIDAGRLRWCERGSDRLVLAAQTASCPFVGIPGIRTAQEVRAP